MNTAFRLPLVSACLVIALTLTICDESRVAFALQEAGYPMRRHSSQPYGEFDLARLMQEKARFEAGYLGQGNERNNNLALIYQELGDYQQAEGLFRSSLAEAKEEWERQVIRANLGRLYQDLGDHARADPLLRGLLQSLLETKTSPPAEVVDALNDMASLQADMGDFAEADKLYRRAITLLEAQKYRDEERYFISIHNLGLLCEKLNRLEEAEKLLARNVAESKGRLSKRHQAHSHESLAFVLRRRGEYARAETHYTEALNIYEPLLGHENRATARVLNNLGFLYAAQGRPDRAEPLLLQAGALRKKLFGQRHWETADSMSDLASLRDAQGKSAEATSLAEQVLSIAHEKLNLAATVQSERRQLLMAAAFRNQLDLYLSFTTRVPNSESAAYAQVLILKGSVFTRQRWSRLAAQGPEGAAVLAELRQLSGKLSALLDSTSPVEQRAKLQAEVETLERRREELENRLNGLAANNRTQSPSATASATEVRRALPAGAVLIDLLCYTHYASREGKAKDFVEARIAAFIIAADRPIVRVELGPAQPIEAAVETWRESYGRGPQGTQAAQLLRDRLWLPLELHLADAKVVLISPDGLLARLPWAALPGSKPDSFLVEEWSTAVVPVPHYLPELLREADVAEPTTELKNLLLIGGVDYDADIRTATKVAVAKKPFGRKPVRSADWKAFGPLEGTLGEIAVIERTYRNHWGTDGVTTLERSAPDEDRFFAEATRHRYLHVATHGFFAPAAARLDDPTSPPENGPTSRSSIRFDTVMRFPGLSSGLALAGANQTPRDDRPDGIVTAEEVQTLNLSGVELATLSACETGLGEIAGSEGTLGLQRAFQIAGARSTVTGLWKVDDLQTRALMERFYRNLWDRDLSKLEALREAQLWMLREGPKRDIRLHAPATIEAKKDASRSPPYYWAPFVLSGDWR